ncbi:hypothetical protein OIU34_01095 [Pararhizobium sp. BT-229]|nr:hypothetical protein [Pararhizobium sp. BT-229]MCV9960479.1 hypothetical protein [Pararhizobium sp. BT-229]
MRATLAEVDGQPASILVRVVDAIERSGSGAKERLVVASASQRPDEK